MKRLEEENNRLFIDAYGLADELTPDVPIDQITLTVNPAYRYGKSLTDSEWSVEHGFGDELEARFRTDTCEELISYAIGCMMGRYSLDEPGLIYAHSGNEGFDPSRYRSFPADDDGIIPVTDFAWFDDDACNRLVQFLAVAWPAEHLDANLAFLAASLDPKRAKPRGTRSAATWPAGSTSSTSRPTKTARSTGSSPAANKKPSSASSTCTATTRARSPGCGRNTSCPCSASSAAGSACSLTLFPRPPVPAPPRRPRRRRTLLGQAAGRAAGLRRTAQPLRQRADQPRSRRRREGQLRQVRHAPRRSQKSLRQEGDD